MILIARIKAFEKTSILKFLNGAFICIANNFMKNT